MKQRRIDTSVSVRILFQEDTKTTHADAIRNRLASALGTPRSSSESPRLTLFQTNTISFDEANQIARRKRAVCVRLDLRVGHLLLVDRIDTCRKINETIRY